MTVIPVKRYKVRLMFLLVVMLASPIPNTVFKMENTRTAIKNTMITKSKPVSELNKLNF